MATSLADLGQIRPFDANEFIQMGEAGQRARTLADLGQYASRGDYQGAERAAWAGGQPDIAEHLASLDQTQHAQLVEDAARFALGATTPQQWEAGRADWQSRGYTLPPFSARNTVISNAISAADQLRMQAEQANADRTYQLSLATAEGGGKPPSGYQWNADHSALSAVPGGPGDPLGFLATGPAGGRGSADPRDALHLNPKCTRRGCSLTRVWRRFTTGRFDLARTNQNARSCITRPRRLPGALPASARNR